MSGAITDDFQALRYDPPVQTARVCDGGDFGTVQIRIGLHSSLQACYKNVSATGQLRNQGTAFITIPREFEGRSVSQSDFELLRDDIVRSENEIYEKALAARGVLGVGDFFIKKIIINMLFFINFNHLYFFSFKVFSQI